MSPAKNVLFVAVLLFSGAARADCAFSPFAFFPERNDRVQISATTDGASFCDNSFREGSGYQFTKVSVVKPPPHGVVATLGPNHYAYHALPNFRGRDQYTIRACAIIGRKSGCSMLIYNVTVN